MAKKIFKALLYPHFAVLLLLAPVSVALLVYGLVFVGQDSVVAYASYGLSAYTLTVLCLRVPHIIRFVKRFQNDNRLVQRLLNDARLRVKLSLYGSLLWNTAYAIFQLGLGFYHASVWFYAMAAYYLLLAIMRFFLLRHTRTYEPGEQMQRELQRYRATGWALLVMNLALGVILFFIVYWGRTFRHHEITAIAMAAYTFTALTVAIVNTVKYRKYNSPVFSAAYVINLAAALVSMLTLETTMLTAFGSESEESFRKLMLTLTGVVVLLLVAVIAIGMVIRGSKKLKQIQTKQVILTKNKEENVHGEP